MKDGRIGRTKSQDLGSVSSKYQCKIDYVPIDLEIEASEDIIRIMTLENLNLR